MMKISNKGLKLIEKYEGLRLTAYKDPVGIWTIGYGHTKGVYSGQKITEAKAEEYLKQDALTAEKAVNKYVSKYHFNQNQYDALVSFAYNIGNIDQLTANGTRSIEQISNKILAYNKAGGKVLPGLTKRRAEEKKLFDTPVNNNEVIDKDKLEEYNMPLIKRGSSGKAVKIWQVIVGTTIDGNFGVNTEARTKLFQEKKGLVVDGIVGPKTWEAGLMSV